jgi:hypothetical protein
MWREDGFLEVYAYIPVSENAEVCALESSYCNTDFATSLIRGHRQLRRGEINEISLSAKMNVVGESNGEITLRVNDDETSIDGLTLRVNPELKFSGIFLYVIFLTISSTFFGGGTEKYQTPVTQQLSFCDTVVEGDVVSEETDDGINEENNDNVNEKTDDFVNGDDVSKENDDVSNDDVVSEDDNSKSFHIDLTVPFFLSAMVLRSAMN